jgi:competence protein ComEC
LASAILLGAREYLGKERREAFFVTGTIHLLAISGLHIGILASVFFFAIRRTNFCSERALLVIVGVLSIVYALLTEARPPVMRATVLVLVVCLARFFHRGGFALNSLSAAALIVLLINPMQLFQVGFHLSFVAVIALVWLTPRLVPASRLDPLSKLVFHSRPWWDRQMRVFGRRVLYWCAASVAIWLLTLPLLTHQFHLLSPIGLLLNVFLWVPVAMALFSGFGILLCGAVVPPVAHVCAWLCASSFRCLESIVHYAESLPLSYFWVAGPTANAVWVFYALLALAAVNRKLRHHSLAWFFVSALMTFGVDFAADTGPNAKQPTLRCTFLAVGHGTSIVLELPDGQTFLYDAGSLSGPDYPVDAISECLWQYGVSRIDGVIISHADADHYNAVPGLARRFNMGTVYVSPVMFRDVSDSLSQLRDAIDDAGIPIKHLSMNQELIQDDSLSIKVLHPPATGVRGSDNANSIVLSLSYLGQRILLTGDLEADGLEQLVGNGQLDCELAMAPHHGSSHSEPARFASWCTPQYVVICAGHQRDYERACQPYRELGVGVFHTARDGAICVTIDESGFRIGACGHDARDTLDLRQSS